MSSINKKSSESFKYARKVLQCTLLINYIIYAEYENNLYLITRLHYTLFTYPNSDRACNGLACKSLSRPRACPSLSRPGPKKPVPKRPGPRLYRAEFVPRVNGPGRLGQKSPHKARVARPEVQHYLQKIEKNLTHITLLHYPAKKNIIISHLEHIL